MLRNILIYLFLCFTFSLQAQCIKPHLPDTGYNGCITVINSSDTTTTSHTQIYLGYINGVYIDYARGLSIVTKLSQHLQCEIDFYYSARNSKKKKFPDIVKAFRIRYGGKFSDECTHSLAHHIALKIGSGFEYRLFAHSRGAAVVYKAIAELHTELINHGFSVDSIKNLYIITLGGFAPKAKRWPKEINIITVANDYDMVAKLGGNNTAHTPINRKKFKQVHSASHYNQWIHFFGNRKLNLQNFSHKDFNDFDIVELNKILQQ